MWHEDLYNVSTFLIITSIQLTKLLNLDFFLLLAMQTIVSNRWWDAKWQFYAKCTDLIEAESRSETISIRCTISAYGMWVSSDPVTVSSCTTLEKLSAK